MPLSEGANGEESSTGDFTRQIRLVRRGGAVSHDEAAAVVGSLQAAAERVRAGRISEAERCKISQLRERARGYIDEPSIRDLLVAKF